MAYLKPPMYVFVVFFFFLTAFNASAGSKNGFDLTGALIPESQIFKGGPDKDGIPAIDKPNFLSARKARFLKNDDRILGIEIAGVKKAYPIKILNWHEIVNDRIGREHFSITYCPLCGTGMAFSARVGNKKLDFGVSGLLYNSDVLLYDRQTDSLWSQIMQQSVAGKYKGTRLKSIPLKHTTWSDWKKKHPDTKVLSTRTGNVRNYNKNPYKDYATSNHLFFPVYSKAPEVYHPKERVLGVEIGGVFKAYPFIELNKNGKALFADTLNNKKLSVHWDQEHQAGAIYLDEKNITTTQSFWFAWFAFHPETRVYTAR
jgi:hypothetical protein